MRVGESPHGTAVGRPGGGGTGPRKGAEARSPEQVDTGSRHQVPPRNSSEGAGVPSVSVPVWVSELRALRAAFPHLPSHTRPARLLNANQEGGAPASLSLPGSPPAPRAQTGSEVEISGWKVLFFSLIFGERNCENLVTCSLHVSTLQITLTC